MKNFPPLYTKTSAGAINIWEVWANQDTVYTKWGQLDGKQQKASFIVEPKNIGKANATTASQQAEFEAEALHKKKMKKKYNLSIEDCEKLNIKPMLLKKFSERKDKVIYPVTGQPKLDGVRCLVFRKNSKVVLLSRGGEYYLLPHISNELQNILHNDEVLDGELYVHGMALQDLNSLVRKTKKVAQESTQVKLRCYDITRLSIQDVSWGLRRDELIQWFNKNKLKYITLVDDVTLNNEDEVMKFFKKCKKDGYEGAVIRMLGGLYRFGYRSPDVLKVKDFLDAEFKIVGWKRGKGKFYNVPIFRCEIYVGKERREFDCTPKGTEKQRLEMLKNANAHLGQMLTVEFADYTKDGLPQFPIGVAVRLKEDMDK